MDDLRARPSAAAAARHRPPSALRQTSLRKSGISERQLKKATDKQLSQEQASTDQGRFVDLLSLDLVSTGVMAE